MYIQLLLYCEPVCFHLLDSVPFFSELTDSIVKFLKLFIPKWGVISSSASGYSFCGCSEDCCCK